MMPSVTRWSAAAALAAVGCISIARIDALSVVAFCLRRMHANAAAGKGRAGGSSCLCQFIQQKTKVADAAAGSEASARVLFGSSSDFTPLMHRNVLARRG